jgi:peptide-methionine (R)-S-oxide reductase
MERLRPARHRVAVAAFGRRLKGLAACADEIGMQQKATMTRRDLLGLFSSLGLAGTAHAASAPSRADRLVLSEAEWRQRLSGPAYRVLREEGTEPAGSSALNHEKRAGQYHCAGCDLPLFAHHAKYDSGTGWPSFHTPLPDALGTKTDFKLIFPRTEYHCARCGGHQGHVFNDGPRPSGKRYCNNGLALRFEAEAA